MGFGGNFRMGGSIDVVLDQIFGAVVREHPTTAPLVHILGSLLIIYLHSLAAAVWLRSE
jgi:hypothetical protein